MNQSTPLIEQIDNYGSNLLIKKRGFNDVESDQQGIVQKNGVSIGISGSGRTVENRSELREKWIFLE